MIPVFVRRSATVLVLALATSSLAHAQATRTWVSGVGDDANPCSRTAPCKTFAGAISKTAAGGEINVLDPGGFGGVTITKSISIESDSTMAGVLVSGTNAIIVSAGPNDVVVLRGLTIEGLGTGLNGIRFLSGAALHVEKCTINNFTQKGIDFEPNSAAQLFVSDTIIRNSIAALAGGILVKPAVGGSAKGSLDNVRLEKNAFGLRVEDNSNVTVSNSVSSNNINNGFWAISLAAGPAVINLERTVSSNNGNGVRSENANATVRMSNVTLMNNSSNGMISVASGQLISHGNNSNNGVGSPTSTPGQQ
jgi:hypothetical protein